MIPYTYNWIDMGGVDLANVMGETFSGLYQRVVDGLNEELVAVFFNWYFSGIRIAPSYIKAVLGANKVTINDLIIINSDDTINIPSMSTAPVIEELSITENGNYSVSAGVDGYSPVHVDVPDIPAVVESLSATENGTYTAPSGVDGYSPVSVEVPGPVISSLQITENGTYAAPEGVDGYSPVTVDVRASPSSLVPLNFDVTTGYVATGTWVYSQQSGYYSDVYEAISGHRYFICLGQSVSNRFRCMFSQSNPALATSNVNGASIGSDQTSPLPNAYNQTVYQPSSNGFITVFKSTNNASGIKSYCWDLTALGISPPTT